MRFLLSLLSAFVVAVTYVQATALTFKLGANVKECFFATVTRENSKVAFYFAVSTYQDNYRRYWTLTE